MTGFVNQSKNFLMREVQASDAKAGLVELLISPSNAAKRSSSPGMDAASRAWRGKPGLEQAEIDRAIDDRALLGKARQSAPLQDLLRARHQGHKY